MATNIDVQNQTTLTLGDNLYWDNDPIVGGDVIGKHIVLDADDMIFLSGVIQNKHINNLPENRIDISKTTLNVSRTIEYY